MTHCPICAEPLPAAVGENPRICDGCGYVEQRGGYAEGRVMAPTGVQVVQHGNGVEIVIPWHADLAVYWIPVNLMLLVAIAAGIVYDPEGAVILILFGAFLLYGLLLSCFNRTTILVAPQGAEIHHGPFPSRNWGTTTLTRGDCRSLTIQEVHHRTRHAHWVTYNLETPMGPITTYWNQREVLAFVCAVSSKVMDRAPT